MEGFREAVAAKTTSVVELTTKEKIWEIFWLRAMDAEKRSAGTIRLACFSEKRKERSGHSRRLHCFKTIECK